MDDYKNFIDVLKCPTCSTIIEDQQADSGEEYKEEWCSVCNDQFGYEEEITYEDDWNAEDIWGEDIPQIEVRRYWSHEL